MARRRPKRWHIAAAIAGGLGVGLGVTLLATRAFAKERTYVPAPGEGPLRPPPAGQPIPGSPGTPSTPSSPPVPMGPPGPLAQRLAEILDDQSDDELLAARAAMPAHWWPLILEATRMPTDQTFVIIVNPIIVDVALMDSAERDQMQEALLDAVGLIDALAMRDLLLDAKDVAMS